MRETSSLPHRTRCAGGNTLFIIHVHTECHIMCVRGRKRWRHTCNAVCVCHVHDVPPDRIPHSFTHSLTQRTQFSAKRSPVWSVRKSFVSLLSEQCTRAQLSTNNNNNNNNIFHSVRARLAKRVLHRVFSTSNVARNSHNHRECAALRCALTTQLKLV